MRLRSLVVCALFVGSPVAAAGQAMVPPKPLAPRRETPPPPPPPAPEQILQAAALQSLSDTASRQDTLVALRTASEIARRAPVVEAAPDEAPALSVLSMLNAAFSEQSMAAGTEALRMRVGSTALLSVFAAAARTEADAATPPDSAEAFRDRASAIGRILTAGGPLALRAITTRANIRADSVYTMWAATGVAAARAGLTGTSGRGGSLGLELALFHFRPGSLTELARGAQTDAVVGQTRTGVRMSMRAGIHHPVDGTLADGISGSLWFWHGLLELLVDGNAAFGLNYVYVGPKEWREYAWHGLYLNFTGHK